MLLDTPLITTLLAALVVLGITYTISTLIDRRIEDIRAQRRLNKEVGQEDASELTRAF